MIEMIVNRYLITKEQGIIKLLSDLIFTNWNKNNETVLMQIKIQNSLTLQIN